MPNEKPRPKNTMKPWVMFLGSLFVAIAGAVLWEQKAAQNLVDQIASEAVAAHMKLKPLEVKTNSIEGVKEFFAELGFVPATSEVLVAQFQVSEQSLQGGRYASLNGVPVAQLRYRASQNDLSTLYQAVYSHARFGEMPKVQQGEQPRAIVISGLSVSMWVENGLLLVLVTGV